MEYLKAIISALLLAALSACLLALVACGDASTHAQQQNMPQDPRLQERGTYVYGAPIAEEVTPVIFNNRLLSVLSTRIPGGAFALEIEDVEAQTVLARFDTPDFTEISAIVVLDTLYVFGTTALDPLRIVNAPGNTVRMISTKDLTTWTLPVDVLHAAPDEAIWNTSVTPAPGGYVMAFDVTGPGIAEFGQRFAASADLLHWQRVGGTFSTNTYSTAVTLRYVEGLYYLFRTSRIDNAINGYLFYLPTTVDRSADLITWQHQTAPYAPASSYDNPADGVGATDLDLAEFNGVVYVLYAVGNQGINAAPWENLNLAIFRGTLAEYCAGFFQ